MRLLLPGWEGNMCVKWLRRIQVTDQPAMTKDETSKYSDLGRDGRGLAEVRDGRDDDGADLRGVDPGVRDRLAGRLDGHRGDGLLVGRPVPGLDAGAGLDAIFALAPVGAVVCPPATLELPNTPGYPAGSEVELLIHGADVEEEWAPYGLWRVVATGRVDDAGERIATIDGGLPVISAVGVRAR